VEHAGEKGREERRNLKILGAAVLHGKHEMQVARARVSRTEKLSNFTTLTSRALGAVQSTLRVGGCGNIFFGQVPVAVRQDQRRDAAATGEERLCRCAAGQSKYIRLYL
jgi:hypothetical protein